MRSLIIHVCGHPPMATSMKNMDYSIFYQKLTGRIRENGAAWFCLRAADKVFTGIMYAAYPILLAIHLWNGAAKEFLVSLLVPAAGFVLLTVVRAKINRPRPYEAWKIDPLIHKDTRGNSLPSRHVFSSALIAVAWMPVSVPVAAVLLVISAAAALIRVLGGVHYPSDVIAGFAAGVLAGIPMLLRGRGGGWAAPVLLVREAGGREGKTGKDTGIVILSWGLCDCV